jgi:hypothetical protein
MRKELVLGAESERGMYVYLSGSGFDGRVIGMYETARITEVVSAIK